MDIIRLLYNRILTTLEKLKKIGNWSDQNSCNDMKPTEKQNWSKSIIRLWQFFLKIFCLVKKKKRKRKRKERYHNLRSISTLFQTSNIWFPEQIVVCFFLSKAACQKLHLLKNRLYYVGFLFYFYDSRSIQESHLNDSSWNLSKQRTR